MNRSADTPKHRGDLPGSDATATRENLILGSRRSRAGVVSRLDERRMLREMRRPIRTDHFSGDAA